MADCDIRLVFTFPPEDRTITFLALVPWIDVEKNIKFIKYKNFFVHKFFLKFYFLKINRKRKMKNILFNSFKLLI